MRRQVNKEKKRSDWFFGNTHREIMAESLQRLVVLMRQPSSPPRLKLFQSGAECELTLKPRP